MVKRQELMAEFIRQERSVTFEQLKSQFPEVSEITIRRDLEVLDHSKQIVRVYGGARSINALYSVVDDAFLNRSMRNVEAKKLISQKAVELLNENTSIFIDAGSTLTEFCRQIPDKNYLIYTSGLSCLIELTRLSKSMVYMLGGKLDTNSYCINGQNSLTMVRDVNFKTGFFGATGYVPGKGFTTGLPEEYELKSNIVERCERVIMLIDTSKFGVSSTFFFAKPQQVDVVVSDGNLPEEALEEFKRYEIKVM